MTFMISVGKYGGFYFTGARLCLGWVAFTLIPVDIDEILVEWKNLCDEKAANYKVIEQDKQAA